MQFLKNQVDCKEWKKKRPIIVELFCRKLKNTKSEFESYIYGELLN